MSEVEAKLENQKTPNQPKKRQVPLDLSVTPRFHTWRRLSDEDKKKALAFGDECLEKAREHWPHLFDKKNMKPLKVGINHDLIAENKLPENTVNFALWRFCKTWKYREMVKENATRYDKDGNPVGKVEKDQSYPHRRKQAVKTD